MLFQLSISKGPHEEQKRAQKSVNKNGEKNLMRYFDSFRFVLHSALLPTILSPEKRLLSLVLAIIANLCRSVAASRKVSPNWSLQTMTCHSSHCFSIVWG